MPEPVVRYDLPSLRWSCRWCVKGACPEGRPVTTVFDPALDRRTVAVRAATGTRRLGPPPASPAGPATVELCTPAIRLLFHGDRLTGLHDTLSEVLLALR